MRPAVFTETFKVEMRSGVALIFERLRRACLEDVLSRTVYTTANCSGRRYTQSLELAAFSGV